MNHNMIDRVRLLAPPAEVSETGRTEQRWKLENAIAAESTLQVTSEAPSSRRRWDALRSRRRVYLAGVAAAVMLVVGGLVVTSSGGRHLPSAPSAHGVQPAPRAQLVDFTTADNEVIARITDPLAAASELDNVFQKHGFDISVQLIPVSPSLVGSITAMSIDAGTSDIKPIQSGPCISGGQNCTVGLILPTDFHGKASVEVGRAAQPGESYASAASPFAPGEVLHCEDVVNELVSAATPTLTASGETVEWREDVPTGSSAAGTATSGKVEDLTTPPPGDYVVNITTLSSTALIAWVAPQPSDAFAHAAQQGCSGGNSDAAGNTGTAGDSGEAGNSGAAGNSGTTVAS